MLLRVINFADARNQLGKVIDQVISDFDVTIIIRKDTKNAVVMSLDMYKGILEKVNIVKSLTK